MNNQNVCHLIDAQALSEGIAYSFQQWLLTQERDSTCLDTISADGELMSSNIVKPNGAAGTTSLEALIDMNRLGEPAFNSSSGAGALSRIIPLAPFCKNTLQDNDHLSVFKLGAILAGITHGHGDAHVSAGALNLVLTALYQGDDLPTALDFVIDFLSEAKQLCDLFIDENNVNNVVTALLKARSLATSSIATEAALYEIGEGWVSPEALALALYANLKAKTALEMLQISALHSGDSDTVCALAAGIYGVIQGDAHELIPIIENSSEKNELLSLIDNLVTQLTH